MKDLPAKWLVGDGAGQGGARHLTQRRDRAAQHPQPARAGRRPGAVHHGAEQNEGAIGSASSLRDAPLQRFNMTHASH